MAFGLEFLALRSTGFGGVLVWAFLNTVVSELGTAAAANRATQRLSGTALGFGDFSPAGGQAFISIAFRIIVYRRSAGESTFLLDGSPTGGQTARIVGCRVIFRVDISSGSITAATGFVVGFTAAGAAAVAADTAVFAFLISGAARGVSVAVFAGAVAVVNIYV